MKEWLMEPKSLFARRNSQTLSFASRPKISLRPFYNFSGIS